MENTERPACCKCGKELEIGSEANCCSVCDPFGWWDENDDEFFQSLYEQRGGYGGEI